MANFLTKFIRKQVASGLMDYSNSADSRFTEIETRLQEILKGVQASDLGATRMHKELGLLHESLRSRGMLYPGHPCAKTDPEVALMAFLYSFLPNRNAIDIGANIGDVSGALLTTGYNVFAFEPFPPVFAKLEARLKHISNFHPRQFAIGASDGAMDLHIAEDPSGGKYGDPTVYNTLLSRETSGDLTFPNRVEVQVRSLESLHATDDIPPDVGLVKIDTEGYDLEVMRGMGGHRYPVVVAEFWDAEFTFGKSQTANKLEDLVSEMRLRDYHWFIVIYRIEGVPGINFFCNGSKSPPKSWGNAFFFHDFTIFREALNWCSTMLTGL